MERRQFLASSLVASALAAAAPASLMGAQASSGTQSREYYQLRQYHLQRNAQVDLTTNYLRDALIPALNRLDIKPVGVFNISIGPQAPTLYVLMPCLSAETLLNVDERLMQDNAYTKAGAPFLNAPAAAPAFGRIESKMMRAFEKMPRLTLPAATAAKSPRVYEMRTYESPSIRDHLRKIEMMSSGEANIFARFGFWQVFYSDTIIGPRQPNLTYMIGFASLAERDTKWAQFFNSPQWKALTSNPRFGFENIVSNVTNLILTPTAFSQI